MIYFALIFTSLFSGFFVFEAYRTFQSGMLRNRGKAWSRAQHPVTFWTGMGAWIFNALVGAAFAAAILASVLKGHDS